MPWTTPKTWALDDPLDASTLNTHIRDNLDYLKSVGGLVIAVLADQKAQNTGGGTFTAGAWRTRDLNTEVSDAGNIVTLSANKFTPIAGKYFIYATVPMSDDNSVHQARLYNSTGASQVLAGSSANVSGTGSPFIMSPSFVMGVFTANGTDAYTIEDRCTLDATFGVAVNLTTEVYTQVTLIKIP